MGRLKLYNSDIDKEEIERSREVKFLLNKLIVLMNGGKPVKVSQEKGIIISKPNP